MGCTLRDFASLDPPRPSAAPRPGFDGVRVIAFDLDNTLVDVIRVKERAAEAAGWALADAGLDVDATEAAAGIMRTAYAHGIDADDVVAEYLRIHVGAPDPRFVHIGTHAFARAEDQNAVTYPRVHATLVELARRGYTLALITDAPRHRAVQRIQAARLGAFFDVMVTLEDSKQGKADSEPYAVACERLDVDATEVLMVGDNPARDIGAARAFGCRAALAAYGLQDHFRTDDPAHTPDTSIEWFDELLTHLPGAVETTKTRVGS